MKLSLFGAALLGMVEGQTYAVGGSSIACADNDHWGSRDNRGLDCDAYANGSGCGQYDTPEFVASALCCNCGGGSTTVSND